jgi:hypothetical protein
MAVDGANPRCARAVSASARHAGTGSPLGRPRRTGRRSNPFRGVATGNPHGPHPLLTVARTRRALEDGLWSTAVRKRSRGTRSTQTPHRRRRRRGNSSRGGSSCRGVRLLDREIREPSLAHEKFSTCVLAMEQQGNSSNSSSSSSSSSSSNRRRRRRRSSDSRGVRIMDRDIRDPSLAHANFSARFVRDQQC